jgi:hypothetical protein
MCDVGCGAADVLGYLRRDFPTAKLVGFDIAPELAEFWRQHDDVTCHCGDFHQINTDSYSVLLMLDVFEHVRNPFSFLEASRPFARFFVFHIPLDLSAVSVAQRSALLNARRGVGHLHFYTKDLALETLAETGYEVIDWRYTGACFSSQIQRTWRTRLLSIPRRIAFGISKDVGVRLLGGETLLVLARTRTEHGREQ